MPQVHQKALVVENMTETVENFIIHKNTKNLSFLKVYRYLLERGVKNNKFFLRLYDKDLEKINPRDENLSPVMKAKVIAEIVKNPFYFLREIVLVDIPGGKTSFELHPGNLALIWSIMNSFDTIILLPRQRYKTISIAAYLVHVFYFATQSTHMLFGNKKKEDSINNLKRFKAIRDNLPKYMLETIFSLKRDIENTESIESKKTRNKVTIVGNPRNEEQADNMGRGASVPFIWSDEYAFISYNDTFLKAAAPAYRTSANFAERDGKPHSKIISTTPNNLDSESGLNAKQLLDNSCDFFEQMYDMTRLEIQNYIEANSSNGFLYIKYTWQQLGLDDKWYNTMCRDLSWDWRVIKREVDLQWTKSADNSVFNETELDILEKNIDKTPNNMIIEIKKANLNVDEPITKIPYNFKSYWTDVKADYPYFVGCDVSGGLGRDYTAIVFLDPFDEYREVALFKNNTINLSNLKHLLLHLVKKFPNITLFIENNSYGKGIIDELLDDPIAAKKLYFNYKIQDKDKTKNNPNKVTNSIEYGVNTNTQSRSLMIDIMRELVTERPYTIRAEDIYLDIRGLIYNRQGKIEHDIMTHDDCLFSKLIVLYAVRYGNNIAKFLRRADSLRSSNKRTNQILNNGIFNKQVDDPAVNLGINIDIQDILRLVNAGETPENAIKLLTENKTSAKKKPNSQLLSSLINKK